MKILIATGIFPPDIGGPALHTKKLAESFSKRGWDVRVVTYASETEGYELPFRVWRVSRKLPRPIRVAIYFFYVLINTKGADAVYAHDPTAVGLPASFAATLLKKKFIIRIGGDVIWERAMERRKEIISLSEYYKRGFYLREYPRLFRIVRGVLGKARLIILPAELLKKLYIDFYGIDSEKIAVIPNPIPKIKKHSRKAEENIILFAGRFVAYKNIPFLIEVFDKMRRRIGKGELHLIGDGPDKEKIKNRAENLQSKDYIKFFPPVNHLDLLKKIETVAAGIGPALTEFNPNFILECLAAGKPVLISRENGLTIKLPEDFLFDAQNGSELENKLIKIFNDKEREEMIKKISGLRFNWSWNDIIESHIKIINKL